MFPFHIRQNHTLHIFKSVGKIKAIYSSMLLVRFLFLIDVYHNYDYAIE